MWRLLHKNVSKQQHIRAQFVIFSLLVHVVLVGPLLFVEFIPYKAYHLQANRSHVDDQAKVVLMPLVKRVNQQSVKHSRATNTIKKSQPVKKAKPKTTLKKEATKRNKPPQKAKPKPKSKPKPNSVQQKPVKKSAKKVPQKTMKKNINNQASDDFGKKQETVEDNIRYVGREELEEIQMQEIITQKLVERWKPPVGLSKDLICEVKMIVDAKGVAKQACIHKASGVLIYDVSARLAAQGIELPQWARGKEFYITFKQ